MRLNWQRLGVVISPSGENDWRGTRTANPDLLFVPGEGWRVYYNGSNGNWKVGRLGLHTIGMAKLKIVEGKPWPLLEQHPNNPVLEVCEGAPIEAAIDPAVALWRGQYHLVTSSWRGKETCFIGLSVDRGDGTAFSQVGKVFPGRAPELVIKNDRIFLFYVMDEEETYVIHLATGADWDSLVEHPKSPIFRPLPGTWEATAVTTPRIYLEEDWYYMVYAGDPTQRDYPPYFGLTRSQDLIHWKRWEGNPFFERGPVGEPDEGAIWYGELLRWRDGYLLYYEGYSKSPDRDRYGEGVSQICVAYVEIPSLASLF